MSAARLLPQHERLVTESGISPAVAEARGYRTVQTRAELLRLGFGDKQARVPTLLIPIFDVHGEVSLFQARPDVPRISRGRVVKYETLRGASMVLDVPPGARCWLGNPGLPFFITEGVRKADSAVSRGLCCGDVLGVWNWRGQNDNGGLTALADWESVHLRGRDVFIAFDSDVTTKPEVLGALRRLKSFLKSRGASVKIIRLPAGEGGRKVGLDDFLVAGHTVDELLALASFEMPEPPPGQEDQQHGYRATPHGLVYFKPTGEGSIPLTNFNAKIIGDISLDDGVEVQRAFEIQASLNDRERPVFTVPASRFPAMGWAIENLGPGAVIYPGRADHTRAAIQLLSGEAERRVVHGHTGWCQIDGVWVYLHAGGAIGADGPVQGVEVQLPDALTRFRLPPPPEGERLSKAIRSSLRLLRVALLRVTAVLFCAIWRAALGQTDLTLHIAGPTGALKTELASLVQRHFGAGMDARHLPGSWSSTPNSLEATAFTAKDSILVVDDFAPGGNVYDVQRLHRDAERIIRAQGNNSARGRLGRDCALRPSKPPRTTILSTGEDVPRGHSVRARMMVLEVGPNDVDKVKLTACQRDAESGLYAEALAGFVRYVAARYSDISGWLRGRILELRNTSSAGHLRTPDSLANLFAGFEVFLWFAIEGGALNQKQADDLKTEVGLALKETADAQQRYHAQVEPARRFIELLVSGLASGRCHLADARGDFPATPVAWGWREVTVGTGEHERTEWRPLGDQIGWLDGDVFLDSTAALATAQKLSEAAGEPLSISVSALHKRLNERGFLASTDAARETLTVRHTLSGKRRDVIHVRLSTLIPPEKPDQPDQPDQEAHR